MRGEMGAATAVLRSTLDGRRATLGATHQDTICSTTALGNLLYAQDELEQAEPLYREALTQCRGTVGDRHPLTLVALNNLGCLLHAASMKAEGAGLREALVEEAAMLLREGLYASRQLPTRSPSPLLPWRRRPLSLLGARAADPRLLGPQVRQPRRLWRGAHRDTHLQLQLGCRAQQVRTRLPRVAPSFPDAQRSNNPSAPIYNASVVPASSLRLLAAA